MTLSPNGQRINNKLYGWLRRLHAKYISQLHQEKKTGTHGKPRSAETKAKISKANKGKPGLKGEDSPNFGLKRTQETKDKMSIAKTGTTRALHTEETKQKMKDARKLQLRTSQKTVVVFGITYDSLIHACKVLRRSFAYVIRRLRSDKYPDCFYLQT